MRSYKKSVEQGDSKSEMRDRLRAVRMQRHGAAGIPKMAQELGLSPASWTNYERGVAIPSEVIVRFLVIAHVSPVWLLNGSGVPYGCDLTN
jgi:transcriptional regulator with XRE-family HTH domain